jgi:ATP-binding cassette subfamily F protein 3
MLTLEAVEAGYGSTRVLREVSLTLRQGERIGLLGPNGAGKTTLVKLLAGALAPLGGARREGKGLALGHFAQQQLEHLRLEDSALQHMVRLDPAVREQDLRDYLGGFNFRGDMAAAPVGPFSGGEKSRLALALLIWQRPNLLLLDEPTNHLDLEMRHALTLALQDFEGTLVVVSHDRHLLRATADRLLLVADGRVAEFDGDLDDYAAWLDARRVQRAAATADPAKAGRRRDREQAASDRQTLLARRRPLQKEIETLERRLAEWQSEKAQLDARLADPASYAAGDKSALRAQIARQGELAQSIEQAEERWLLLHDELERIGTV